MLIEHLNRRLLELDAAALRRRLRVAESPCEPLQAFEGEHGGEPLLAFCSNDYLGLAHHPGLATVLAEGARLWGTGSGASHLVSGHLRPHAQVEELLARWFEPHIPHARALLMCSGYMANLALMTALGDGSATLFCDKLNHASLIDGARLAEGEVKRYAHGRLDVLESQLAACTTPIKLIVTDAVFSMDGDIADLPALLKLAEKFDAWIVLDDAHGLGVLGLHGHGALEHFELRSERFICMGTLGKAAGVSGAFVAAHPAVIEWLVQKARSYIYTTAMPPALAHVLVASLKLIGGNEGRVRRARLLGLIEQLRTGLRTLVSVQPGWKLGESATAIQPLIVGDNETALNLSAALRRQGLYVPAMRPPTVPPGTARLRITLSAAHTPAQVQRLLQALAQAMGETP
ncbi:8-amino-7-oxononanoate synthase [Azohydromonas aeria]|uniref:8-amino-7-oxononanoate synthase n=1 Tax=Azohydromonas aeria TaxID=2590212 RepID=UPI0012F7D768|nr:8-amino-7-oxononanoate synthase [Azohydromonas aeria]